MRVKTRESFRLDDSLVSFVKAKEIQFLSPV